MDIFIDTETVKLFAEQVTEDGSKTQMYQHEGVWFADTNVAKDVFDRMKKWEARHDDAYVVSYPKTGTTWTQEIMFLALNKGDVERTKTGHTMVRIPYIEANVNPPKLISSFASPFTVIWYLMKVIFKVLFFCLKNGKIPTGITPGALAAIIPSPRLLKSHLPFQFLPEDIMRKRAKIIYVARNPKDMAVSYYKFHQWMPMLPDYDTWDDYFEDLMAGKLTYGHWYEHYLGFWKRRNEENILFIKYEDMKKDPKESTKLICEFLGYHYSQETLDEITEHCSFANMKKNPMTNPDSFFPKTNKGSGQASFMRKGQVGDWKNYFSEEQSKAFDEVYKEKLEGTGLEFDFK